MGDGMMVTVFVRRNADGVIRQFPDDYEFQEYLWAEGNYSCDCNRELFFARAAGDDRPHEKGACGYTAYDVRIEDAMGNELYRDGARDWEAN